MLINARKFKIDEHLGRSKTALHFLMCCEGNTDTNYVINVYLPLVNHGVIAEANTS